jgi:hypothetical protein
MTWCVRIALVLVLFAVPVGAQSLSPQDVLPDKPSPQPNLFTRPFHDIHILVLAEIDAGTATWDDVATRRMLDRGGYERNPLMRPFVHNSGTLALETVGEVWVAAFVADRMKRSSHAYLRKTWWLPQVLDATARIYGGINNTLLLRR